MKYLYHHRTQGINVEGVHIRSICKALEARGHALRLVSVKNSDEDFHLTSVRKNNFKSKKRPSLLKTLAEKLPEPLFEAMELGYNLYAFFRLWLIILQYRPDRIYERYSLYLFSTLVLARCYRIPIIYEINDSALLERVRPLFFKKMSLFIEKRVFKRANGLVFVSKRLKEIINNAYHIETKDVVTPNAADKADFFYDREISHKVKQEFDLEDKVVCGFIGSFAKWHGMHHLVEEIAPVMKNYPDLVFLLVGEGQTLPHIRRIIAKAGLEKQFILVGNVPHDEIIRYIRVMDFSVLPNSNEYGSPMKMFELMGAGVPLIAADYPPVAEIIEEGVNGWLFEKGRLDMCMDKILYIYEHIDEIAPIAFQAEQKIHRCHQWSNNARQLDHLYPDKGQTPKAQNFKNGMNLSIRNLDQYKGEIMNETRHHSDVEQYMSTIVSEGLYSTERNLRFYLKTLLGKIDFENKRVLDIGGGNGLHSFYAACRGAKKVVCLEPEAQGSRSGVNKSFQRVKVSLNANNVYMVPLTLQDYEPEKGEKFDIVLLQNSINHLNEAACIELLNEEKAKDDYIEILFKVSVLTDRGAKLIACDCSRHNFFNSIGIKNPFAPSIEWHKHQAPETWIRLLKEVGFIHPKVEWLFFSKFSVMGRMLIPHKALSYFLTSHFCLTMDKP